MTTTVPQRKGGYQFCMTRNDLLYYTNFIFMYATCSFYFMGIILVELFIVIDDDYEGTILEQGKTIYSMIQILFLCMLSAFFISWVSYQ